MPVSLFSQHNCTLVKSFLNHRFGEYITNVTQAAEVCSDFLCQGNGRCVRRDPHAHHYLHLSADSYQIHPSGDGDFTVNGWPSQLDLQLLTERFCCHCYEGHEGDSCDSLNKVKEDDEPQRKKEKDEQEKRRAEWEDEQAEQWESRDSEALITSCSHQLVLLMLLLNLLLRKQVE